MMARVRFQDFWEMIRRHGIQPEWGRVKVSPSLQERRLERFLRELDEREKKTPADRPPWED